ncbi:growth hormone secretagogue receptor type 1-like [Octopus sinensis]|uniref:Growth hormone secretagogue receptor type 1-like n=1 Tax=Octopus sinensis TaxID=2607531 RepID=A0A6P7S7F3_9MOLL|nr:growth hormone secretagogue receptor type 1-like [Octopus sinensis]XP_036356835.1 growth hormone secretagogue receptor type 1-like [Octopus sinensis]
MKEHTNLSSNFTLIDKPNQILEIAGTLHIYALPVLIAFGIPSNLLSLVVFTCSTAMNKLPSSTYMAALALSDSGFLSILLCIWLQQMKIQEYVTQLWCQVIVFGAYIFGFLSVWFTVLFTIERYKVICYPLKATQICSKRRARLSTLIICIIAMFLYFSSFWTTINHQGECTFREELFILLTIITYVDTIITFLIPFLAIVFMNIRIIFAVRALKKRINWLQESQPHEKIQNLLSKTQMKLTKSLVIVSSVFLMLVLPSHFTRFYFLIFTHFLSSDLKLTLQTAQYILQFPYYLTFGINFLLYTCTSYMFRQGLLEIYRNIKEKVRSIKFK